MKYKKTLWIKISLLFSLVIVPIVIAAVTENILISYTVGFAVLLLIVSYRQRFLGRR